jgi:hypothetical protein
MTLEPLHSCTAMASETPIQKNLVEKNAAYASTFTQGDLALPPAKKYAVGESASMLMSRIVRQGNLPLPNSQHLTCYDCFSPFSFSLQDIHVIQL